MIGAMKDEIASFKRNNIWEKCMLPKEKKTVGYKWVLSIKYHADGTIKRYKVRLVGKRYTQTYGVDYSGSFSLVAKLNKIRVLLATNEYLLLYRLI